MAAGKLNPQPSELMASMLAILQTAKAVQASLGGRLELEHGLSLSEVDALANLSAAPGGTLRMSRISEALVTNRPTVTRLIDGLEIKGLVARRALPGDRRAVNAVITDAGLEKFREVCPYLEAELGRELGEVLGAKETAGLAATLARILARLGEDPTRYADPPARATADRRRRQRQDPSGSGSRAMGPDDSAAERR